MFPVLFLCYKSVQCTCGLIVLQLPAVPSHTHVCVMFSELFTIIVDMLAILVHGTLAGEQSEKGEENKKVYQSLIRKLKVCSFTIL